MRNPDCVLPTPTPAKEGREAPPASSPLAWERAQSVSTLVARNPGTTPVHDIG